MEWQDEGYLELADVDAGECHSGDSGLWARGLLIRRTLADGACAYFTTGCPAGTALETLLKAEGQRWTIEDSFETVKNELGLDLTARGYKDPAKAFLPMFQLVNRSRRKRGKSVGTHMQHKSTLNDVMAEFRHRCMDGKRNKA